MSSVIADVAKLALLEISLKKSSKQTSKIGDFWFVLFFQARSFSKSVPAAACPAFLQTVSLRTSQTELAVNSLSHSKWNGSRSDGFFFCGVTCSRWCWRTTSREWDGPILTCSIQACGPETRRCLCSCTSAPGRRPTDLSGLHLRRSGEPWRTSAGMSGSNLLVLSRR